MSFPGDRPKNPPPEEERRASQETPHKTDNTQRRLTQTIPPNNHLPTKNTKRPKQKPKTIKKTNQAVATDYGLALSSLAGGSKAAAKRALVGKKAGNMNFTIPAMEMEQQCAYKCCNKDAKVACLPQMRVPAKTPALPFCPEGCSVDLFTKSCKCGSFKVADCPVGYVPCGGLPPNAFCMKAGSVDHPKASEIPVVAQCAASALKCAGKGLETCAAKRKRMML